MSREFGTIIQIGDILVSEDAVSEWFACDYEACKGACCIEGDSGAPLEEDEPEEIERAWDAFSGSLPESGLKAVTAKGFFEIDRDGDMVTPLVDGTCECAYARKAEDGGWRCVIEECHLAGKCSFRKPISCSLYPIRVTRLTGGGLALNVHRWHICKPAFEKGCREGIRVYEFLKEPLTRAFGADFYDALCAAAQQVLKEY